MRCAARCCATLYPASSSLLRSEMHDCARSRPRNMGSVREGQRRRRRYNVRIMAEPSRIGHLMQANADQAVRYARDHFRWELDFSPASLERVDRIIDVLHVELPKSLLKRALMGSAIDAEVWGMAKTWGAYVGETFRRQWGGRWKTTPTVDGHVDVFLETPRGKCRPIEQVRRRLAEGSGGGVTAMYADMLKRGSNPT